MFTKGSKVDNHEASNLLFWSKYAGVIDSTVIGQNWIKTLDIFDSNYASIKWFEESFNQQYTEFHFSDWAKIVLE
jgi:hypothetical protein